MQKLSAALLTVPNTCLLAWGWRRLFIATVSGLLSALSMPPFGLWPVLFITIPLLIWLLDGAVEGSKRRRRGSWSAGFSIGWWFGFGFFLAGLWWIGAAFLVDADRFAWLMPPAVLAMPAGLAFFPAIAMAVAARVWPEGPSRLVVLALALSAADYVRGHSLTGFPWNTFGYAYGDSLILAQSVSILGVYGLGLFVLLTAAAPAVMTDAVSGQFKKAVIAASVLVLASMTLFGVFRLHMSPDPEPIALDVHILQPAIPQAEKWKPENRDWIFQRLLDQTAEALSGAEASDRDQLVVWPESAPPFLLTASPDALVRLADVIDGRASLAVGAIRAETGPEGTNYFNSVYLFGPDGTVRDIYDKVHLVPFGEYLPFERYLNEIGLSALVDLPGVFQPGFRHKTLKLDSGQRFLPLICYEAIFPAISGAALERPDFLLNVTNDAWFGDTPGPWQHLAQARMRAIERGLPLARSANTGVSSAADSKGREILQLNINKKGILSFQMPGKLKSTFYNLIGDGLYWMVYLAMLCLPLFKRYNPDSRKN